MGDLERLRHIVDGAKWDEEAKRALRAMEGLSPEAVRAAARARKLADEMKEKVRPKRSPRQTRDYAAAATATAMVWQGPEHLRVERAYQYVAPADLEQLQAYASEMWWGPDIYTVHYGRRPRREPTYWDRTPRFAVVDLDRLEPVGVQEPAMLVSDSYGHIVVQLVAPFTDVAARRGFHPPGRVYAPTTYRYVPGDPLVV